MIKRLLDLILKKEFSRNILTMLSGATIAQLISMIIIPFLTRIFSPEQFGDIAIYLSLANILGLISTGLLNVAIVPSKNDEDAYILCIIGLFFVITFSTLCLFALLFFKNGFINLIGGQRIGNFFYLLPLSILFIGVYKVLSGWFNRYKKYKTLAINRVVQLSSSNIIILISGLIYRAETFCLYIGNLIGQFLTAFVLLIDFNKEHGFNKKPHASDTKRVLKENKSFPLFLAPMVILNSISIDILIYGLNFYYSPAIVGFYSNSRKMMFYPLALLSASFTTVFYQKIVESKNKRKLYLYSYFINLGIALCLIVPVIFFGKQIFTFVLGGNWEFAGQIAIIMAPFTAFNFATSSVSYVFSAAKKNDILLVWQIIYLASAISIIYFFRHIELTNLLRIFTIFGSIMYIILAFIGYKILDKIKNI